MRLSPPQKAMLDRLRNAGISGERTPMTGNKNAGRSASAWYRTAYSLQSKGLIVMRRSGDAMKAFLPQNIH